MKNLSLSVFASMPKQPTPTNRFDSRAMHCISKQRASMVFEGRPLTKKQQCSAEEGALGEIILNNRGINTRPVFVSFIQRTTYALPLNTARQLFIIAVPDPICPCCCSSSIHGPDLLAPSFLPDSSTCTHINRSKYSSAARNRSI